MKIDRRWMQWSALHELCSALEEEYWNMTSSSNEEIMDSNFSLRWAKMKICAIDMGDCTFKELLLYYHYLNRAVDRYDVVPEYKICLDKYDKLRDQYSSGSFIDNEKRPHYFSENMEERYNSLKEMTIEYNKHIGEEDEEEYQEIETEEYEDEAV